jgi:dTDP-4-dehydrorhamnose reductase
LAFNSYGGWKVKQKLVVIGSNGQLGTDLIRVLNAPSVAREGGDESLHVIPLTHRDIEVFDDPQTRDVLTPLEPNVVINTAAYHRVDECEDNLERALEVNAIAVGNLALVCRDLDALLVHVSTDYVFSGRGGSAYVESDPVDPINIYGASKAAGEMILRASWPKHMIVRSSGLYGLAGSSGKGGNFVETMLRLAHEGKAIRVVNDQTLTPSATSDLARQIIALIDTEAYGTYHATCQGACSWYDFAAEIFRLSALRPELTPQTTGQSGARAQRPVYSVLDNRNLREIGLDSMPPWQESLEKYLGQRQGIA